MELTPFLVNALKGEIIEKHLKEGETDIAKLKEYVYDELPQLICDIVNPMFKELEQKCQIKNLNHHVAA